MPGVLNQVKPSLCSTRPTVSLAKAVRKYSSINVPNKYNNLLPIYAKLRYFLRIGNVLSGFGRTEQGFGRVALVPQLIPFQFRAMKKICFILFSLFMAGAVCAQSPLSRLHAIFGADQTKPQVLLLGVFHFSGEQVDDNTTPAGLRVDMLSADRQRQIEALVSKLAGFRPTKIAIEGPPQCQHYYDSLYRAYCAGTLRLTNAQLADEKIQLAFRLAKKIGLSTLCPVDAQPFRFHLSPADSLLTYQEYENLPDTAQAYWDRRYELEKAHQDSVAYYSPLKDYLRYLNDPAKQARTIGRWLISTKKGSATEPIGADGFITRYFNRNVRIYANIQRLVERKDERILVIYGATHTYLLKTLFAASPQFQLKDIQPYLR